MDYQDTLDFLFSRLPMFQRVGAAAYKADLSRTVKMNVLAGNPEKEFPSVHIAGTNGKGSVAHLVASVLQEAGYKTGLFTSPHLVDFRERIKVNGSMIPEEAVVSFVQRYRESASDFQPSFFEYTFTMAMEWFRRSGVDVAVVETGMGGRLDSTNTVKSILSVITNIGFDHQQFLGDSLSAIASEKAGIIKPKVPVVVGRPEPEMMDVIRSRAAQAGSEVVPAPGRYLVKISEQLPSGIYRFQIRDVGSDTHFFLDSPLGGYYQNENFATALTTLDMLKELYPGINQHAVQAGFEKVIKNTGLRGRWEKIAENPLVIADTAHNADGLRWVTQQLREVKCNKRHIVLGLVKEKNLVELLRLFPGDALYYFCQPSVPRAMPEHQLVNAAMECGLNGKSFGSVTRAYEAAMSEASDDDLIFVGGSTFTVADLLRDLPPSP
ncbi:MAG: folylpolyglutamate synthase/dihydrofolate synthase family protein [Bacteroidales bacterium]